MAVNGLDNPLAPKSSPVLTRLKTLKDLKNSSSIVAFDVAMAFVCSVPIFGFFASCYVCHKYLVRFPWDWRGRTWTSLLRAPNPDYGWFDVVKVVLVFEFSVTATRNQFDRLASTHSFHNAVILQRALFPVLFLATVVVKRIFMMACTKATTICQQHKRQMKAELKGEAKQTLIELEKTFKTHFVDPESERPGIPGRAFKVPWHWKCISMVVSVVVSVIGYFLQVWALGITTHKPYCASASILWQSHTKTLWQSFFFIFRAGVCGFYWYHFSMHLIQSGLALKNNVEQLLLFQVVTVGSATDDDSLLDGHCGDISKIAHLVAGHASDCDDTEDTMSYVQMLRRRVGAGGSFRMSDCKAVEDWWQIRNYLQVDFLDDTASVEYALIMVTPLVGCFLGALLVAFESCPHIPLQILALVFPLAALLLFLLIVCFTAIDLNTMLEKDHKMVLCEAVNAELKAKPVGGALKILHTAMKESDRKVEFFGFALTTKIRNALIGSIGLSLARLLSSGVPQVIQWLSK